MKTVYFLFFLFLVSVSLQAQFKPVFDYNISLSQKIWQSRHISENEIKRYSDLVPNINKTSSLYTNNNSSQDSTKYNMYGDLLDDNPLYNEKSSVLMVALRVTLANVSTFLIDRYILNYNFSRVGFNTIKHNIKTGWEWDVDRFGMNYFFHPFSGAMYYNAARANGYSFYESIPFAYLGSLEWEYFCENTLPSYNDLINTPVNGVFLGEIFYRLGSNILDDQTSGFDRFSRELAVAIMTPTRFFSRLLQGKLTRTTTEEVYQKEPLNIKLSTGYHRVNEGKVADENSTNSINFTLHFDYGNPLEKRSRKPFDYFKFRTDFDFGVGRKIISLVTGNGILFGSNFQTGSSELLAGLFQHMDFYDNKTFELGAIAFGPGIISKLAMNKSTSLYTTLHVDLMPFGALSNRFGPDTTQVRDYNYAGGAKLILESNVSIGGWLGISFGGYYWWFSTYVGNPGNSYIGLIKPSISFRIFDNLSVGLEQLVYYSDRYPRDFPSVHSVRTEQKIFLQLFLEEFKFKK